MATRIVSEFVARATCGDYPTKQKSAPAQVAASVCVCECVQHELIERKNAKQIDKFATIAGSRLTSNRSEATTIASDGQAAEDGRAYANADSVCTGHVNFLWSKWTGGRRSCSRLRGSRSWFRLRGSEAVRVRGIAVGKPQDMFASCPGDASQQAWPNL